IPFVVVFWIVPPETVKPPAPVLFSRMPFAGPEAAVPADPLGNFNPEAPIVVFATLSAVPVVVVIVLVVSVAVTVPPPVAVKALLAPVLSVSGAEKPIVAPVLPLRKMPWPLPLPVSLIAPAKEIVPPVAPVTETRRPVVSVIVPL